LPAAVPIPERPGLHARWGHAQREALGTASKYSIRLPGVGFTLSTNRAVNITVAIAFTF
jgi:hypothetical protein